MNINAAGLHFKDLNERVRETKSKGIVIDNCVGQRYIASGLRGKKLTIYGTPGNALGAYLDGSSIEVYGNTQEATGDTMNDGTIVIHGCAGDATGYGMRGGKIFVEGDTGYRAGIHMKEYQQKVPLLVIGGKAGSFLGEYQAGGLILVLGIGRNGQLPVGRFCGTGMHGGKMILRCDELPYDLPPQVTARSAGPEELKAIAPIVREYCGYFDCQAEPILDSHFFVLEPDTKNPYKQLYTAN